MSPDFTPIGSFCSHSHKVGQGDHICKLYELETNLLSSVCDFIVPALTRNEGVLIIATPEHIQNFQLALERRSIDVTEAVAKEQLIFLDAHSTLSSFMEENVIVDEKFREVLEPKLKSLHARYKKVRAYGEMVNLLFSANDYRNTLRLEQLWNELSSDYPFSLLCSYSNENFKDKEHVEAFNEIARTHSHRILNGTLEIAVEGLLPAGLSRS